ncbi:MAG: peptide/nickel transport system substrate-binding protein [Nitrospirae bacterium]|nr:MAG: peptide/nickel transport system substrate-binding protein [Nitrospirota bacterium]
MGSRKRVVLPAFTFLLLFLFLLAGCTKEPKIKNPATITLGALADAKRLLPMLASDSASGQVSGFVHNGLTKYDKNIRIKGELAESWDISRDGLTVTFHLRKGVKWHDGKEFTADDVVFTYETVTNPKTPTPYGSNYGPVRSVRAIDSHTVRVTYSEPYAPALESWGMGIIPKHLLEGKDIGASELNRKPVGTGPYRLKEWVAGQKIVLEAFDEYFEGRPNIDRIVIRVIPDTATMFLELKFGGIDVMNVTPPQFRLQINTEFFERYFSTYRYPSFSYTYLGYNLKHPLFGDLKVRQAIAYAINKDEIIAGVLLGLGAPCTGPFPQESWAFNPNVRDYAYDPAKALAILGELGWKKNAQGKLEKDGKPFSFTVITNQGNDARLKTAQILKEQFKRVGIDMNIKVLEWQAMLNEFVDKRRFEGILMGWGLSRDPDLYDIWHSSKTKEKEFNFISYKNDEVDRLLVEGRSTFDIEKRKQIYRRIHEILAAEQPYAFLYVPDALPVLHKRFKGVEKAPLGIWHDFIHWHIPKNRAEWYQ